MKLYKISQNIEYLDKLGVPAESQQEILNYLMSLDNEVRKIILRQIKKNPSISLDEIKTLETDTKKNYLRNQGYDESIIDVAVGFSQKYSVWLAREIKNFRDEGVKNYIEYSAFHNKIREKYGDGTEWEQVSKQDRLILRELRNRHPLFLSDEPLRNKDKFPWNWGEEESLSHPRIILDYIKQNDPDIMSMSYKEISDASDKWHKELAEQEAMSSYKSHNVVYTLSNGWEIVDLEPGDCKHEGELMGHCVSGYDSDIAEGKTKIFSLRDIKNKPHVTLEMDPTEYKDADGKEHTTTTIQVRQIQGKSNDEPIDEYKAMIKEWFDSLKKNGFKFDPMEEYDPEHVKVKDLPTFQEEITGYGIPYAIQGIGGSASDYYDNLMEAYEAGNAGSYWYQSTSERCVDALVQYAEEKNELEEVQAALEGFDTNIRDKEGNWKKSWKSINDITSQWWMDSEEYIQFEHPRPDEDEYPEKEDFMTPNPQAGLEGMPEPEPIFNEEAYNKALKEYQVKENAHEEELGEYEEAFDPYIFQNYVYKQLNEALERKKGEKQGSIVEEEVTAKVKTRIYKMAEKEILSAEATAQYVEALELYAKDHPELKKKFADLVTSLPSPRKIRKDFSIEECKIVFETLDYLWKKITGEHIIQETEVVRAPETLFGNYWLIKNGILLKGVNHFSIIKNNASLFCTLLNLNGMTLQEHLANKPNKLIEYILNNGGVRLFVNKDKKLYAQMSSETYGKWGKTKIKKYDFKLRAVKVIDFKRPYDGWKSGITIKL